MREGERKRGRTESTRRDVGGDHDGRPAALELGEYPITLLLLLVTVNGERRPSVLARVLGEVVGDALGADEDEDLGRLGGDLLEVLDEPEWRRTSARSEREERENDNVLATLLKVGTDLDDLSDAEVGGELERSDGDLNEVLEVLLGELLDLLGPGGTEHERLRGKSQRRERR